MWAIIIIILLVLISYLFWKHSKRRDSAIKSTHNQIQPNTENDELIIIESNKITIPIKVSFDIVSQGQDKEKNVDKEEPSCPYCHKILDKMPQRKKKCPFCKSAIYIKNIPSKKGRFLVTEEDAKKIDAEWEKIHNIDARYYPIREWLDFLSRYGITREDFDNRHKAFSEKHEALVNDNDVIWSLYNELIAKTTDYHDLKMIYYNMAILLNKEGKEFFHILQLSSKMQLMTMKQMDIKKVEISTAGEGSCESCRKLEGRIFRIEDALEKMPIPCKKCNMEVFTEGKGFCRCMYSPVIE